MLYVAGEKSEGEAEFCFLELPARMENGSAGVGADTVLTVVDVDAGLLHRLQLEVVVCSFELLGCEVACVEGEEASV